MEILTPKQFHYSKYGYISIDTNRVTLYKNTIYNSFLPEESNHVLLKDMYYRILNGILYVKGTRIYQCHIRHLGEQIDFGLFSERTVYKLNNKKCNELENPPKESEIIIKRKIIKDKKIMGFEILDDPYNNKYYYKLKKEKEFAYIISTFKLQEK